VTERENVDKVYGIFSSSIYSMLYWRTSCALCRL